MTELVSVYGDGFKLDITNVLNQEARDIHVGFASPPPPPPSFTFMSLVLKNNLYQFYQMKTIPV